MDARSLVFDIGDRITGWGRFVADADGEWLDLQRATPASLSLGPRSRSRNAIRLIGADAGAVPDSFGPDNASPGFVTITGIWRGDAIDVESQSPVGPPRPIGRERTTPPCPPPAGGWPAGLEPHRNLTFDLRDLVTSGIAVSVATFRPGPDQAVLVVAATDVDAVEAILRHQLPDRLCVVPSRWTRTQLDDVRAHFDEHWHDWYVQVVGDHTDGHGQPSVRVELLRVTDAIANWADSLPDSILTLEPALTPVAGTPGHT